MNKRKPKQNVLICEIISPSRSFLGTRYRIQIARLFHYRIFVSFEKKITQFGKIRIELGAIESCCTDNDLDNEQNMAFLQILSLFYPSQGSAGPKDYKVMCGQDKRVGGPAPLYRFIYAIYTHRELEN